jgi:oxalate decarboxylase/phosphoglucose isomerase-like protein (cupin superfamily)
LNDERSLFNKYGLGKIINVDKYSWSVLKNSTISCAVFYLQSNVSTDCFWYKNVDALYVVIKGEAIIYPIMDSFDNTNEKNKIILQELEVFFVPKTTPHSILNISPHELKIIVFYSDNIQNFIL